MAIAIIGTGRVETGAPCKAVSPLPLLATSLLLPWPLYANCRRAGVVSRRRVWRSKSGMDSEKGIRTFVITSSGRLTERSK